MENGKKKGQWNTEGVTEGKWRNGNNYWKRNEKGWGGKERRRELEKGTRKRNGNNGRKKRSENGSKKEKGKEQGK